MTLITAFSSRLHRLDEMLRRWIGRPALVMLISVSPYLIPGIATRMVLPRNRALGITLVVLSLVLAGVVLRQLRIRLRKPGPPIYIVAMLSTLLFLGVGSFAAISAAIFTSDPLAYKVITPRLLFDVS